MLLFANNATSECAGSISATETQINVAAGEGMMFPNPGPGDYFVATLYKNDASELHEIIWVTARAGDTMTIVRAQENTQALPWNPGDTFSALITAGMLGMFDQGGISFGPENLVYIGDDTGGPNVVVVPIVKPLINGLIEGMTFNIAIAANNTGPATITIGGFPTYPMVRLDGSPLIDGNLTGGEMMKMWFDGARFVIPVPPVKVQPSSTVFYLDPNGNDNNDGLSPGSAFKTPSGAALAIETRYAAQPVIYLTFANGVYLDGVNFEGGYISTWILEGNMASPDAVVLDARDFAGTAAKTSGVALDSGGGANVIVRGISFLSHQFNIQAGGGSILQENCVFTPPVCGAPAIVAAQGGAVWCFDRLSFHGSGGQCDALFYSTADASLFLAEQDAVNRNPVQISFTGAPNFTVATAWCSAHGLIQVNGVGNVTFVNPQLVVGATHSVSGGSGLSNLSSLPGGDFPGSVPGTVDATTFSWKS